MPQFKNNPQFQVLVGSRAKTILAINNKKKPLDDVRVRRAIAAAIDRKAVIEGAADGFGAPIGSHYVPGAAGYVDTTGVNPYNIEKAKALLTEAGVKTPLELTMTLPPPPYARQGGEVIAAQLAKIGINVKMQNVEWAQWLSATPTAARTTTTSPSSRTSSPSTSATTPSRTTTGATSRKFNDAVRQDQDHAARGRAQQAARRRAAAAGQRLRATASCSSRSG